MRGLYPWVVQQHAQLQSHAQHSVQQSHCQRRQVKISTQMQAIWDKRMCYFLDESLIYFWLIRQ